MPTVNWYQKLKEMTMDPKSLQYHKVPDHSRETLDNYWKHGWEPGSFITNMLVGDLYAAAARADFINKPAMAFIAEYIVNEAPEGSWGNMDLVRDWCKKGHYYQQHEKQRLVEILSTDHKPETYDF